MPKRNNVTQVIFYAYNTDDGSPATGESTLTMSVYAAQDAGGFVKLSSPPVQALDTVNMPGYYRLTLSAAVCDADSAVVRFISSTSGVVAQPCQVYFEKYAEVSDIPQNAQTITATGVADAILTRDVANIEASAPVHSLCTVILAHMQSSVSGNTWNIFRTDGATPHATLQVSAEATDEAITGVRA